MSLIERYIVFKGKPFSLETAVKETGLRSPEARKELQRLEELGKLRRVRDGYIPLKRIETSKKSYDFRFKAEEIRGALEVLREWRTARELARELRCSYEKSSRLLRTLYYMRYVKRQERVRGFAYRKVRDYTGEIIPRFWGEVAKPRGRKDEKRRRV